MYMYIHTSTCTCTYIHTYMYINTYIHTYIFSIHIRIDLDLFANVVYCKSIPGIKTRYE